MIRVYSLEQAEAWDAAVRSFRNHDVYWLSGYSRAFRIHGDGEPLLIQYEGAGIRGITVVMKRDIALDPALQGKIPEGQSFDFATPYGYGGWLTEGAEETEAAGRAELFSAYGDWLREQGIVSEFVRFHPMIENHTGCGDFYEVIRLGEVVHIDLASEEEIWAGFTAKNRNMIRKAEKNGVTVRTGRSREDYAAFREIYDRTMVRDEAEPYYFFGDAFYDSVCRDLAEHALVFHAEHEGRIIASSIMIFANGRMNYHLSGSLAETRTLAPTNLILSEAAKWGLRHGCRTLYLGGGVGSGEDALFRFKRAFNRGELKRFHIGRRILDPEKYAELVSIRKARGPEIRNPGYFPAYRG